MSGGHFLWGISIWELIIVGTVGALVIAGVAAAVILLAKGSSDKEH